MFGIIMKNLLLLLSFFHGLSSSVFSDPQLNQWASEQKTLAFQRLLKNVNAPGTARGVVIASPSQQNPDYYYHWVRDAGIVMDIIAKRYESENNPNVQAILEGLLFDFADFSLKNQATPNLSGSLGEPKFFVDGEPYLGP